MTSRRSIREASDDYPQSRAAKRELYGPRSIDASAPMANPATNIGAVGAPPLPGQGLTDAGGWDAMFRKPSAAAAPGDFPSSPQNPTTISGLEDPSRPGWEGGPQQLGSVPGAAKPTAGGSSLPLLASGGVPKHSDTWGGGWQTPAAPTATSRYVTPGTTPSASFVPGQNSATNLAKRKASPFQWGA